MKKKLILTKKLMMTGIIIDSIIKIYKSYHTTSSTFL